MTTKKTAMKTTMKTMHRKRTRLEDGSGGAKTKKRLGRSS